MLPVGSLLLRGSFSGVPAAVLLLHHLPLLPLLFVHALVIFAQIARLFPQLVELSMVARGHGPDVLAQPLVAFSVFLDALLDLLTVQLRRGVTAARLGRQGLRGRHVTEAEVTVSAGRRRQGDVLRSSVTVAENLFDLQDGLGFQEVFVVQGLEDLFQSFRQRIRG